MVLEEPATSQADLEKLTNEVKRYTREVNVLEDKLRQSNPADDKLAIYKSQATAVSKKKESKNQDLKKLETEKMNLEKQMAEKENEYAKTRGATYMKRDDFRQYAASLRGKNNQYKRMKKTLDEIRSELMVLTRTEQILKSRAENVDEILKKLEQSKGIAGYSRMADQIEDASNNQEKLDNKKDHTLAEITKIVQDIESQLKDKKAKLAPQIKQLRQYRQKYQEVETIYNEKKKAYDNTVMNLDNEKKRLEDEVGGNYKEYKEDESKFHTQNIQNAMYDAMLKRVGNEQKYLNTDKRMS